MFSTYPICVAELLQKIESGEIALPDLQRPFVWEDAKVRNLLDSMNKGFPVGYVMLWDFPNVTTPSLGLLLLESAAHDRSEVF